MAVKVKYELPDHTILEDGYLRVQNITTSIVDYEHLKPSDKEGFELETEWVKKVETKANVFVFADKIARDNGVAAIDWFPIEFEYQLSEYSNIYEQAYKALKNIYTESEDC